MCAAGFLAADNDAEQSYVLDKALLSSITAAGNKVEMPDDTGAPQHDETEPLIVPNLAVEDDDRQTTSSVPPEDLADLSNNHADAGIIYGAPSTIHTPQLHFNASPSPSMKTDGEGPEPQAPRRAEVPDQDWVVRSVRDRKSCGRYQVRWKPTWEQRALLHYTEKYGWFVVIQEQRWAIYRLSTQALGRDDDGNETQRVYWKDSLAFDHEIPDAMAQVRRYHARQQEQRVMAESASQSESNKLLRSVRVVESDVAAHTWVDQVSVG